MTQLTHNGGSDTADSSFGEGCTSLPILTKAQQIYLRHAMHEIWHLTRYAIASYSRLQELSKAMLTSTAEEQFYLVRLINSQQSDYHHSLHAGAISPRLCFNYTVKPFNRSQIQATCHEHGS